ncbi:alcohol dehydrogenase catalytic domain-containing protein [Brevibacterium oceani]|uniref:alcohol dehydrogenase catalytic domain-containing protein n=1 Tax=Brevibacterium oceani TaxID=358099 RepID=UPI001B31F8D8|nr:alcohol dehydrogenase catalytic domain-containing protein [Brevibacterium oceani]
MKAARFYGKEDLRLEEIPELTEVGPGQVKVKVGFAGICGSDLHVYYYPELIPFISDEPHPLTGAKLPQILGHEISGTIVEAGDDVDGLAVGDRGAVFPLVATCGKCSACRNGVPMSCRLMAALGSNAASGGLSDFIVIDADKFHRLPENVDLRMGALVEPMAVGWHAVVRSGAESGSTALLVGAGPVGIGAWYAFRAMGIDNVLVSETNVERRQGIAALGATVIDPVNEDLAGRIDEMTAGEGVSAAVEASGSQSGFDSAMANLAPSGRVSVVAMYEEQVRFDAGNVMLGQREIVGAVGYEPQDFDDIIEAMSRGVYSTEGWVTEREFDAVETAIRELRDDAGSKILIKVNS